ncbi:chemotaxis protein CheB [Chitinophaga sp. S165]|uniref:chemotaxis protein CheB n=1 Tax=Chitinophaga sp. S165 TaxID=2135462 RepID=UPI000D7123F2|nr:chemotaxis protein CheB [Chitinophaga sp. S165]PWV48853.1 CheB methylesterase [Chitinophaga sp. S165]
MMRPDFYIAGLGCSAGCLEVLKVFFSHLPKKTGVAYIIVQHLLRNYTSKLDILLQTYTPLPIVRVAEDMRVNPDHIYLIPEGKYMVIEDGILRLIPRGPEQIINFAVDIFFRSLAAYAGPKAIGIILTGMGMDGLEGAKAIEKGGGIVFVQEPASATFKGMPEATITGNSPDGVMAPEQLAQTMERYAI